ncbi:MAG TPA: RNA polymerase sigma factor [Lachnospiraceae bacterium]|nr:RNA polymerase sigma factor [Lachnospiraceae bacterium]
MEQSKENKMEQIIKQYGNYVYNYALRLCAHPDTAQDLSQDTFLQAWCKLDQLREEAHIKSWLRKICLNPYLMQIRRKNGKIEYLYDDLMQLEQAGEMLVSTSAVPEEEVLVEESIRELQNGCFLAMVRKLTLHQRIAFSLVDMFGISIDEVSDLLEITHTAVKGLLYRARMNLDSFFADHCTIIHVNNPCKCEAWLEFARSKERNRLRANQGKETVIDKPKEDMLESLDYRKTSYTFDPEVRSKVKFLYSHMPDRKPPQEWYDNVINIVKK